jgi:RNA polymerase-binding transcription factor DksA
MRKEDLANYRQELMERKGRLTGGLSSIVEEVVADMHAPNEPLAVPSEAVDKTLVLQETEEGILQQVRDALERIEDGTFGKCRDCSRDIPAGRLQAIPFTPRCVECAKKMERIGAA